MTAADEAGPDPRAVVQHPVADVPAVAAPSARHTGHVVLAPWPSGLEAAVTAHALTLPLSLRRILFP